MIRSVTFDLVTLRERNHHVATMGGRMAQAKREKTQRETSLAMCEKYLSPAPALTIVPTAESIAAGGERFSKPNAIKVTITRIGPGRLDDDGPSDAGKNCRDGVADWLGVNDGDGSVFWAADQEKTPSPSAWVACPTCLAAAGRPCNRLRGVKERGGYHLDRKAPWRVRITIEDLTFGPDRPPVVLASTVPQKRPKAKKKATAANGQRLTVGNTHRPGDPYPIHGIREVNSGKRGHHAGIETEGWTYPKVEPVQLTIGDDEQSPRVLVPCSRASCFAALGLPCLEDGGAMIHGVHVERARAAGVVAARLRTISRSLGGLGTVQCGPGVDGPTAKPLRPRRVVQATPSVIAAGSIAGRPQSQTALPLVRVLLALPWLRGDCAGCNGFGFRHDNAMAAPSACKVCNGTGRGKAQAVPEPRIDGLRPPAVHRVAVPHQHASAHGKVIEMYPRRATVAGCDVVIYETKEARR